METETLIGANTAGLLFVPTDYVRPRAGLLAVWRRHLIANAAVRNRDYMEALFKSHFPHCRLLEIARRRIPLGDLEGVDNIVLLFPDSIGTDFGWIERTLASRWPSKRVLVLNGRRRLFRLDPAMRRRLAVRRFLEATRLPEMVFFLLFIIATPFLLLLDMIRGKR